MPDPLAEAPDPLSPLRAGILAADRALVDALARRFELVDAIARAKAERPAALRDPERERDLRAAIEAHARDAGVSVPLVRAILGDVLTHSLARQALHLEGTPRSGRLVRVAFQGVAHAYSHLAAQKYLADRKLEGAYAGHRSFADALGAVTTGTADLAVLPIENTTTGAIASVYELLRTTAVHLVGEVTWRVDHCLAAPAPVALESLRRVLSHPQGLEQCSAFLQALPLAQAVPWFDTAEALAEVARAGDPTQAAIGSPQAADAHGLHVLRGGIADHDENWTRFIVAAREPQRVDPRVACKTTIVLHLRHEHGALARALAVLAGRGVQLTRLESRPRPGRPWEYMFFVDLDGDGAAEPLASALAELRAVALSVQLLGSYAAVTASGA